MLASLKIGSWTIAFFSLSQYLIKHVYCRTLEIGADRFKVPDVMFNPSIVQVQNSAPFKHNRCLRRFWRHFVSSLELFWLLSLKLFVKDFIKWLSVFIGICQTIPGMEKYSDMIHSVRGLPHMVNAVFSHCKAFFSLLCLTPQSSLYFLFTSTGHGEH